MESLMLLDPVIIEAGMVAFASLSALAVQFIFDGLLQSGLF